MTAQKLTNRYPSYIVQFLNFYIYFYQKSMHYSKKICRNKPPRELGEPLYAGVPNGCSLQQFVPIAEQ